MPIGNRSRPAQSKVDSAPENDREPVLAQLLAGLDVLPMQRIVLARDARLRLSKAALAFIETAKAWFASHDVFTA
ncbi:MAG: hypothetical protein E5X93_11255 [Mesorhizobium sp.]|nr:MAG: hypothetical protein E5X93_11255 [Mesorhizobium sp.]